jgi:hypothetical protein
MKTKKSIILICDLFEFLHKNGFFGAFRRKNARGGEARKLFSAAPASKREGRTDPGAGAYYTV